MLMYSHKHQKKQKKNLYNVQGQPTLRKEIIKKKKGKMFKIPLRMKKKILSIPLPFCPMAALYPLQSVSALDQKLGNVFIKKYRREESDEKNQYIKFDVKVEEPAVSAGCARNKRASMIWWWRS